MRIKRIFSFILILSMLCITIPIVSASEDDIDYNGIEVKLLQSLNILSISESYGDFSLDGNITRGQFALYVARLLMIDGIGGTEQYFTDVPSDHFAYSFINGLVDRNIIARSSDGNFYPNEYITYEQAVKILVSALGYYPFAVANGGWTVGYLNVAKDIELTKGVKATLGQPISKATAIQLLYNSLNIGMVEISGMSGSSATYVPSDERTLLSMRDIYLYEGQVNQIYETSLNGSSQGIGEEWVKVGEESFKIGTSDIRSRLGEYVRFYYQGSDVTDNIIIFIERSESEVTEIQAENIIKFSDSTYYYESDNAKTKRIRLDPGFDVIYNNKVPTATDNSYMVPKTGTVKIIDNNSTDVSSVVIISEYKNYVASVIDDRSEKIYDKTNTPLDLSSIEYKVYNANGSVIMLDTIKEGNVLSVYESDDSTNMGIYVSTDKIEGTLTSIRTEDNRSYIEINDKKYIYMGNLPIPTVSTAVVAYLDIFGNIAFIEKNNEYMNNYGYLLKTYLVDDITESVRVKVLTTKGVPESFYLSEKVRINDVKPDDVNAAYSILQNISKNVIKYEVNNSNLITKLYVYDSSSDDYVRHLKNGRYKYNTKQKTFSGQLTLADDALVFVVPENADDDDYVVGNRSTFANDKFYDIDAYTFGDTPFAEVIIRSAASLAYEKTLSVVTKVKQMLDEDDEVRTCLHVLHGGKEEMYYLKDESLLGNVERGDVIRIALALNNDIENILHIYDKSEDKFLLSNPYQPESANGYFSNNRVILGNVYSMTDGLMRITTSDPSLPVSSLDFENCLASQFTVYGYEDENSDRCSVGSYLDIISYENSSSGYSKVIVATNWGDPTDIIIIN